MVWFKHLPDPMPSNNNKHYKPYYEVIQTITDKSHMPSLKTIKNKKYNIPFNTYSSMQLTYDYLSSVANVTNLESFIRRKKLFFNYYYSIIIKKLLLFFIIHCSTPVFHMWCKLARVQKSNQYTLQECPWEDICERKPLIYTTSWKCILFAQNLLRMLHFT